MVVPFDVTGIRAYAKTLGQAPAKLERRAETVLRASAARLEAAAKQRAAVDTGNMRNSIGTDIAGLTATVGPTASYAPYVEYGTSSMAPQPFIGPALDQVEPQFLAAMEHVLGEVLN